MTQQESTQLKLLAIDAAFKNRPTLSTGVINVDTYDIIKEAKTIFDWLKEEPVESKIVKLS